MGYTRREILNRALQWGAFGALWLEVLAEISHAQSNLKFQTRSREDVITILNNIGYKEIPINQIGTGSVSSSYSLDSNKVISLEYGLHFSLGKEVHSLVVVDGSAELSADLDGMVDSFYRYVNIGERNTQSPIFIRNPKESPVQEMSQNESQGQALYRFIDMNYFGQYLPSGTPRPK